MRSGKISPALSMKPETDEWFSPGRATVVFDGQFGSTGKGLMAAWLASRYDFSIATTNNGPNAGHTAYHPKTGKKIVVKQLPMAACINPNTIAYLNAGAVIDIPRLIDECKEYGVEHSRVFIHPRAVILEPIHKKQESVRGTQTQKIASTGQGVGSALSYRAQRTAKIASDFREELECIGSLVPVCLNEVMRQNRWSVLVEVPQGYDLSVSSRFYPYCTSRNCGLMAGLADAEIHPQFLWRSVACLRTYPIRVGNTEEGYSGDWWPDQDEINWEKLGVTPETTTVTGRIRRVATFSPMQLHHMLNHNRPNAIFLNFCNYMKEDELRRLDLHIRAVHSQVMSGYNTQYLYGFGPLVSDIYNYIPKTAAEEDRA